MKNTVKKISAGLLSLLVCLNLSACSLPGCFRERENKTAITLFPAEPGHTLRIDARVASGCIRLEVRDGGGNLCFSETLRSSKSCSFNVYLAETYTVTAVWEEAKGEVEVYQTRQGFPLP